MPKINDTYVLGLHVTGDQSSAALFRGGELVAALAEERLNREKRTRKFPRRAIASCLEQAGLKSLDEVDYVVIPWNPLSHMKRINMSGFTSWRRYDPEWLYIVPNNLMEFMDCPDEERMEVQLSLQGRTKIVYLNHHLAHLGWAFASPFEKAAFAIIDEHGEFFSSTFGKIEGNRVHVDRQVPFPHSLGIFYATFTQFLGFTPNSDEWKVMGAAAYGEKDRLYKEIRSLIKFRDGEIILDQYYFEFSNMKFGGYFSEKLEQYIGVNRRTEEPVSQVHYDIAAATQAVFEDVLIEALNWLHEKVPSPNLVVSGGCFMNCLANGKILERTPFSYIYISFAPADNGSSIGGGLWMCGKLCGGENIFRTKIPAYSGPEYSNEFVGRLLNNYKLASRFSDDIVKEAVDDLATGKIIGWFQGRMEFGERALGNRSILADPRDGSMKERINRAVKYREDFRPFAPSILSGQKKEYFDFAKDTEVPYMEQVCLIRNDKRDQIPAVVHHDGTGRLQTVRKEDNPVFHRLLSEFHKITGIPLLLNTSFNLNGEPIVCSPPDAIRTFMSSGMDSLYMGNYVIRKSCSK